MSIASEITRLQNAKAALKESIEAKGVTVEDTAKLDEYPALVDSIPQGGGSGVEEKDVNFYDYDGTCVYSYTKDEFLALSEMPALPDHSDEGAIADKWSCTFSYARIAAKMGYFNIIAVYNVVDKLRVFVTFDENITFPLTIRATRNTSITVDWGDGVIENINLSSSGDNTFTHTFSIGSYIIKINEETNYSYISNGSTYTFFGNDKNSICFSKYVKKIFFGNIINGSSSYLGLHTFDFPILFANELNFQSYIFSTTISPYILINKLTDDLNFTSHTIHILDFNARSFTSIKYDRVKCIIIENNMSIVDDMKSNTIRTLHLPNTVTSITVSYRWQSIECLCCFSETPPSLTVNNINNINDYIKIYVPAESVEAYKAATNWSALADKIFPIPTE